MIPTSNTVGYPFTAESNRLTYRPLTSNDALAWTAFMENPNAIRHFPGFKTNDARPNAIKWIQKQLDRYEQGNYGMLALIEKTSGAFVGQCGLLTQEIDGKNELEIGYSLIPKFWGSGYASEAAQFVKAWAWKHLDVATIISIIKTDNIPSQKVATKMGMKPEKNVVWKDIEVAVYSINNPNSDL